MFHSKSQRNKKIIQTEDERIFYTAVNHSKGDLSSQTPQKTRDSLPTSLSSKPSLHKKKSPDEYKIGNYLIGQTLGEGTFGKVKLGIYLPKDEKVAIKVLEKKRMINKDDHIRLKREFDMINEFNHPNVILVHEIFETNEKYYCVMEYCEGGELFHYIVKKKRLTEKESAFLYFQLINGLEYIHSLGIVHRDLKPENLLLSREHLLKIIDFGLSNYFKENQTELLSTACGSPCYASPEMVSGKKYDGIKIDIWASGIILFAMINGYLPFEDDNNEVLFDKILECKIEFPEYMSEESIDLIKKILVVDPEQRITIPEIKKHPFFIKGKSLFDSVFTFKPMEDEQENESNENKEGNKNEEEDVNNERDDNNNNEEEVVNINEKEDNIVLNHNKEEKLNNKIQYENDLQENKENINTVNKSEINNVINKKNNILKKKKISRNKNKGKNEQKKDGIQKNMKNNKRSKEHYNKCIQERKTSHNKINIIDSTPSNKKNDTKIISEIRKKSKNNIFKINKTEDNKNGKIMKLKEKAKIGKIRSNLIIDTIIKERNTIGSIASVVSSNETINNISQQTNITNNMANIIYYTNTSLDNTKRTYTENCKYFSQLGKISKNNIAYTLPNNNNLNYKNEIKNNNNINIIENNNTNKLNKNTIENSNNILNHFNYNYNYMNRKNKINKIRNNNHSKNQKNCTDKTPSKKIYNSNIIKKLRRGVDFRLCKLINDINIKNNYKGFLNKFYHKKANIPKNLSSKFRKDFENFYTDRNDCSRINTNNNINSMIKFKKINIVTPKLKNNLLYQASGEYNPVSISLQTEQKLQNKINNRNTVNNSKVYQNNENQKSNVNLNTNNIFNIPNKERISYPLQKGKIRQKIIKYKINQLFNSSNKKEKEKENSRHIITNYKMNNLDFIQISNTYKTYQKNISNIKPKNFIMNNKKAQIENKIIEKASKSIEIKIDKDSFFKPIKNKFIHIENNKKKNQNICSISNINNSSNNEGNYIKIIDITPNQSKSKSKKKNIKNENQKYVSKKIPHGKKNLLKINKFKKICYKNNEEMKKNIHTKTVTKVNNYNDNVIKYKRNKIPNNLSNIINHKISYSSRIQNNNLHLFNGAKQKHKKNISSKIKESNKNNAKTKLIKVYLSDINRTGIYNEC